jgi:hypothetical protein
VRSRQSAAPERDDLRRVRSARRPRARGHRILQHDLALLLRGAELDLRLAPAQDLGGLLDCGSPSRSFVAHHGGERWLDAELVLAEGVGAAQPRDGDVQSAPRCRPSAPPSARPAAPSLHRPHSGRSASPRHARPPSPAVVSPAAGALGGQVHAAGAQVVGREAHFLQRRLEPLGEIRSIARRGAPERTPARSARAAPPTARSRRSRSPRAIVEPASRGPGSRATSAALLWKLRALLESRCLPATSRALAVRRLARDLRSFSADGRSHRRPATSRAPPPRRCERYDRANRLLVRAELRGERGQLLGEGSELLVADVDQRGRRRREGGARGASGSSDEFSFRSVGSRRPKMSVEKEVCAPAGVASKASRDLVTDQHSKSTIAPICCASHRCRGQRGWASSSSLALSSAVRRRAHLHRAQPTRLAARVPDRRGREVR